MVFLIIIIISNFYGFIYILINSQQITIHKSKETHTFNKLTIKEKKEEGRREITVKNSNLTKVSNKFPIK